MFTFRGVDLCRGRESRQPRRDDRAHVATERREGQRVVGMERAGHGVAGDRRGRQEGGARGVMEEREEEEGQEQRTRNRRSGAERRRRKKGVYQGGQQVSGRDGGLVTGAPVYQVVTENARLRSDTTAFGGLQEGDYAVKVESGHRCHEENSFSTRLLSKELDNISTDYSTQVSLW